jgi:hypothetical protein
MNRAQKLNTNKAMKPKAASKPVQRKAVVKKQTRKMSASGMLQYYIPNYTKHSHLGRVFCHYLRLFLIFLCRFSPLCGNYSNLYLVSALILYSTMH